MAGTDREGRSEAATISSDQLISGQVDAERGGRPLEGAGGTSGWAAARSTAATRYGLTALGIGLAFALKTRFPGVFGPPHILFYPAITAAAVLGGAGPGLLATALSAYLALRTVLPGHLHPGPLTTAEAVSLVALTAMGVLVSVVAGLYRRGRDRLAQVEQERVLAESKERALQRVAEGLRASEERLRLFVEHTPAAVAMLDRQMRYLVVSRRYLSDYRLEGRRDLVGLSHYDVFPEMPERWKEIHRRCLAGAVERCEEDPSPRADGTTDWVRWEIRPWRGPLGEIGGLVLFSELVNDRKHAEERLAAERERLAVTLQSIGEAVIATDQAARVTVINGVAEALTGWTAAEAVGRPLHEVFRVVSEETRELVANPADKVLREGVGVGLTNGTILLARDGSERPIAESGAPIRDAAGAVHGVVLVFRDQTAQRRAERARRVAEARLIGSERRYRLLADHAHDVIWTLDLASGQYTYISPSIKALRGLTVEEALAEPVDRSLTPESLARVQALMARIGTSHEQNPITDLYDQPCKDGTIKHVEITTTLVRDPSGRAVEVVGVSRDATARVEAQRALVESEELYRSLFQLAPSGVVLSDDAGAIVAFNDRACRQLGYSREEFARLNVRDIDRRGRDLQDVTTHLQRLAEEGVFEFEAPHHASSGEVRDVLVSCRPVRLGGRRHTLATWQDVTEHRRAEEALRRSEEQFRQAQRLESVGRLAGGVAHDFNNLLTVILSCTSSLEEAVAAGRPGSLEEIREIDAAGKRAADLTRQLSAFARKQLIAPVPLDLGEVVRGSERMLRRLLGEDVDLRVAVPPGLWTTHADRGQVEQVIVNLAVNARDAMPRGGTLAIETRNERVTPEDAARDPERIPGEWVQLVVRDEGIGMTPEVRANLFEPFFPTKEQGKGTGLGLAAVYGIVKQAGGQVRVRSEPGHGATFIVCLPRIQGEAAAPPPPLAPAALGGTEGVLVVEDDAQVRAVTVRALGEAGYQVVSVSHPQQALELPPERTAGLRLLVTDVVMPGMGGRALARELCQRHPALRVLYLSGYAQDTIAEHGVLSPGIELLQKPFTGPALLARVRSILDAAGRG